MAGTKKKNSAEKPIYGTSLGRRDLEPFLPESGPLFAYVFSCTFASTEDLEALRKRLEKDLATLPEATRVYVYAPGDPKYESVGVEFTKKQWGISVKRDGKRYRLEITFREKGKPWGSNFALWNFIRDKTLPVLRATEVVEDAHAHAHRFFPD